MQLKCSDCKRELDSSEFYISNKRKSGFQCQCKSCLKIRAKVSYQKHHSEHKTRAKLRRNIFILLINKIKNKACCCSCGMNNSICLDFHHLDDKEDDVSTLALRKSPDKLLIEINKCVVICANCHRLVHKANLEIDKNKICNITKTEFDSIFEESKKEIMDCR